MRETGTLPSSSLSPRIPRSCGW
ncbi:hypothetical protein BC938DRAFT_474882 [Jimgerdemannia flammicorona]|uniref:Uncharacterized protein n=1 Tax=Jimgerdemannia flammicorona TaxID=994334 RepID=A0A433Q1H9_9FUNG|nr:hypothetical protein BC938DRAFT_474882 [Jimgerdemannia flammicorona]